MKTNLSNKNESGNGQNICKRSVTLPDVLRREQSERDTQNEGRSPAPILRSSRPQDESVLPHKHILYECGRCHVKKSLELFSNWRKWIRYKHHKLPVCKDCKKRQILKYLKLKKDKEGKGFHGFAKRQKAL